MKRANKELIASACNGDEDSLRELLPHIRTMVATAILSKFGRSRRVREWVPDAVSEVVMSMRKYSEGSCAFSTWVYRCAQWHVMRTFQYDAREKRSGGTISIDDGEVDLEAKEGDPVAFAELSEAYNLVVNAMRCRLTEKERTIVRLRVMYGWSLQETGDQVGVSQERVRQVVDRALYIVFRRVNWIAPEWVRDKIYNGNTPADVDADQMLSDILGLKFDETQSRCVRVRDSERKQFTSSDQESDPSASRGRSTPTPTRTRRGS